MNNTDQRILSFYALDVEILSEPNQDVRNHLEEMVLGTPGKLQYRFIQISDKLSSLKDCRFLILKKSGRVIGSVCLIRRKSPVLSGGYPFWYIRYMFIRAPLKPKSYKQKRKKRDSSIHLNLIWNSVLKYIEQPEILIDSSDTAKQSMLYSYVLKSNLRAVNINNSVGIVPVKKARTYFFSRTRPVKNTCVRQIREDEKGHVINLLRGFYNDYVLYSEQNLFYKDQYYVYVENNEIVAGMQANKEAWEFVNKPGLSGFVLLKVLPLIPVISRYWKPRNFRFTAIEGLFYKEGHEKKLIDLMESVCAINDTHFIFYWTDPASRIYNIINQPGIRGFMSRFFPSEDLDICAKFINWKQEEIDDFIRRPAYISCFDST
jgi:hypothetical protein